MKIVFINFKDVEGGAGIAAYRLSKGLEERFNTENYFIVGKKLSCDTNVFATIDKKSETLKEIQVFIEFFVNRLFNWLGLQYWYFPFSTRFILKKIRQLRPDIISLHNTHGGYFKTSLIKKLSKMAPVVWTLHDMWAFTGNAAHTFGDESWKQLKSGKNEKRIYPHIGIDTGRWLLKQKRRIYKKSDLHIVTPSRWLYHLAKQSPVFENKNIYHIFHGVDLEVFRPRDKTCCRKAFGIAEDAKVIIFSSADDLEKSPWKGGPILLDILKTLDSKTSRTIEMLVLGKGELKEPQDLENLNIHKTGYVNSEKLLPVLLSTSDLFIYPTKADSFSLVLMESIACGVPAVSFEIGGCGDIIKNDVNGYLIKPFDIEAFTDKIAGLLDKEEKREKLSVEARGFAEQHFGLADMVKRYHELFNSIIQGQRNREFD
ncbi:MAG: glycosyltransferase [Candidatus Aminicenantes bacterium]|nr:MAG: glycosyltransferase [Candidatus Aminicenantes bacterium]